MTNTPSRISLGGIFYLVLAFTLGGYFTFAAVQGDYGVLRRVQTGHLYSYAFWMVIGLALLLGWFLIRS